MEMAAQEKPLVLKKHINAIHCTNNLSLVQRKLFNVLLFNAYKDLPSQNSFTIQSRRLCEMIGYNSNDYGKLKKALLGLITIAIEWNVIDYSSAKSTENWQASSILSSAKFAEGMCTYEYSLLMKELLYQPEIYGKINIKLISQFKSSYALALYENCIRYQELPQTPWFPLETFRKLMGVLGDKYKAFNDFNKRVLKVAIDEINQLAPIHIQPEIKRLNQQVVGIRFKIISAKNNAQVLSDDGVHAGEVASILSDVFSLSPELIKELLTQYGEPYIHEKVNVIMSSDNFKTGRIRALSGYIIDALRKDYKPSHSSDLIVKKQRKVSAEKLAIVEEKQEKQRQLHERYVHKQIDLFLNSLTEQERGELLLEFRASLKIEGGVGLNWYKKYGLDHPGIKALYHAFIKSHKSERLGSIMSQAEFLELVEG